MEVRAVYPEQLTEITELLNLLNQFTATTEKTIMVDKIRVLDDSGSSVLGYCVDEVGGAWSFRAATDTD